MATEANYTAELLSAYLSGDVASDERMAVERLLSEDVLAQEQLDELRELSAYLKNGSTQASPEALETLRRAVFQQVQARQLQTLVFTSVTGELNAREQNQLEAYFAAHPNQLNEQRQAAALTALIHTADVTADNALAGKLRARISAALPAAAMLPKAGQAVPVKSATDTVSMRLLRPSARVFIPRETPWKKRLIVAGSIAAALTLAAGTGTLWVYFEGHRGTAEVAKNPAPKAELMTEIILAPRDPNVASGGAPGPMAPPHEVPVPAPAPENVAQRNDYIPNPFTRVNPPQDRPQPPPTVVKGEGNPAPHELETARPPAPRDNNNVPKVAAGQGESPQLKTPSANGNSVAPMPDVAQETQTQNSGAPNNNSSKGGGSLIGNTGFGNGGGGIVAENANSNKNIVPPPTKDPVPSNPNPVQPPFQTTAVNPGAIQAQDGMGVVGAISANGLAQMVVGGVPTVLSKSSQVPSGAVLETNEKTHVALVLPGNGKLYVNSSSTLKLTVSGNNISIDLQSGEIYYKGSADGTLTLSAVKVTVSNGIETDVSLAGQVTAVNLSSKLLEFKSQGSKTQKVNLANGMQGSAAPDGSDTIKKDNAPAQPGNWRSDVLLDGDGLRAGGKSRRF